MQLMFVLSRSLCCWAAGLASFVAIFNCQGLSAKFLSSSAESHLWVQGRTRDPKKDMIYIDSEGNQST